MPACLPACLPDIPTICDTVNEEEVVKKKVSLQSE